MMKPAVYTKVVESLINDQQHVCINCLVLSTRKELKVYFAH
jgi:hypothetical protein